MILPLVDDRSSSLLCVDNIDKTVDGADNEHDRLPVDHIWKSTHIRTILNKS